MGFDLNLPMAQSTCVNCGECMITCPTGAITYGAVSTEQLKEGLPVTVEDLRRYDIFQGISPAFLERSLGGIRVRHYAKGDVICRQGEFGSTAYFITNGECNIFIDKVAGSDKRARSKGPLDGLLSIFSGRKSSKSASDEPEVVPIDATVDLKKDEHGLWVNTLRSGDLVGEIACINNQPRSATVVAASVDVEVIELLRNVLELLRKNKAFRDKTDANYKKRALAGHLGQVELFTGVPAEFIKSLEGSAEIQRL